MKDPWNPRPQVAKGIGARCLIWAALGSCTNDKDENVEDDAKRGETKDNGCDGDIDRPEVTRERATEKQQCNLQHQRQRLHHIVEVPGDDTVELALSILAAFDGIPSQVGRCISVQPLLSKHREEGGEEGSSETCVKDRLDLDDRMWGAGPLREGRSVVSKGGIVDLEDKDAEESGGLVVRIGSELRLDVDDECGCDRREQTGL